MRHIAITADPGSALARTAETPLILPIGTELVGPKTKGYTASVAALLCLQWEAEAIRHSSPTVRTSLALQLSGRLNELMGVLAAEGEALARNHSRVRYIMVLGQGRHHATALEGALKVVEMSGVPACGIETEEALHGWLHALREDGLAIFVAGSQDEIALAQRTARVLEELRIPSHTLIAGHTLSTGLEDLPDECDLLAHIVPLQVFAFTLAVLRGVDPNRMPYPGLSARLGIKSPPPASVEPTTEGHK
jgi:glucosamine 6-phosphate synthetase-like amidotransferase/phosphosugar isomerase protein